MVVERREHRGPIGRILGRFFPKNGETQPQLDTEAGITDISVRAKFDDIYKEFSNSNHKGNPITDPELEKQVRQVVTHLPESRTLTVTPKFRTNSNIGRQFYGFDIRAASTPSETTSSKVAILLHCDSSSQISNPQIEKILIIGADGSSQPIGGESKRNDPEVLRLLYGLAVTCLTPVEPKAELPTLQ